MKQFRQPNQTRLFWADAICINQGDHREKGVPSVFDAKDILTSSPCSDLDWGGHVWPRRCLQIHFAGSKTLTNRGYQGKKAPGSYRWHFGARKYGEKKQSNDLAGPWLEIGCCIAFSALVLTQMWRDCVCLERRCSPSNANRSVRSYICAQGRHYHGKASAKYQYLDAFPAPSRRRNASRRRSIDYNLLLQRPKGQHFRIAQSSRRWVFDTTRLRSYSKSWPSICQNVSKIRTQDT